MEPLWHNGRTQFLDLTPYGNIAYDEDIVTFE